MVEAAIMKSKIAFAGAALAVALFAGSSASADPRETSPNDPTCRIGGKPALMVHVTGLKNGAGKVRVQAYGPGAAKHLAKGGWAGRVDYPLGGRREANICLPLPRAGAYSVAVRHDSNANRKSDMNDGAGFSRNPKLSLLGRPSFGETAVRVGNGPTRVNVVMNYRKGIGVGPIS